MYKGSCTNLLDEPRAKVTEWLATFDSVITDCDGVLWIYGKPLEGAANVLNQFVSSGKKIFFCTNNSTKSRQQLLKTGLDFGINITEEGIISTAHSTAAYLKARGFKKRAYIVGVEGIAQELDAVGISHTPVGPDPIIAPMNEYLVNSLSLEPDIGAVIVGFDEHFSFPKMVKAASYLNDPDCLFLATNTDERLPFPKIVVPDSGSMVRAVQMCAEREPIIIGKPNPRICEQLIATKKIDPARTLMIGDRSNTDILLGHNCGFQTLLVGSGIHQLNDVAAWQKSADPEHKKLIPDVYLPKLGDLLTFMLPQQQQ